MKRICIFSAFSFALFTYFSIQSISPYFSIRSQGFNNARHLSGWTNQIDKDWHNSWYGSLSITPEYSHSFDSDRITRSLFGDQLVNNKITISGSRTADRGSKDWLADYFYLPTDFKSNISFKPTISNVLIDFNFFLALNDWCKGLYIALYAPIVHTRWDLNMCEQIISAGVHGYDAGYFSPQSVIRGELLKSFTQYANGIDPEDITQNQDLFDPNSEQITVSIGSLTKGIMSSKQRVRTRLADLRAVIGWNFFRCDWYHFGLGLHLAAPTGNRPEGVYFFEPVAGTGHHTEVGGCLNGHCDIWKNNDESFIFKFTGDATVTHLISTRQRRTFDLKNRPFSRYMLAISESTPVEDALQGDNGITSTTPSIQFKNIVTPLANLTNVHVNVKVKVQAEITALFTLSYNNFSWDIGYDFWAISKDHITITDINPLDNNERWVLKGDSYVYGYANYDPAFPAIALAVSQNSATIHSGKNFPAQGTPDIPANQAIIASGRANPSIDNPQPAIGAIAPLISVDVLSAQNTTAAQTNISINPIVLKNANIDLAGSPRTITSKIFSHISYTWNTQKGWIPFIGIGGQAEFAHGNPCKPCHKYGGISQWAIWIKGGISFE
jgi:hypothetical protein